MSNKQTINVEVISVETEGGAQYVTITTVDKQSGRLYYCALPKECLGELVEELTKLQGDEGAL